jgi:hypothetical protein
MKKKFIDILTFNRLISLILECTSRIIFSSGNLHLDISTALLEASKKGIKVKVIIDPSEQNYRNGFGDIKSIDLLQKVGIEIYEVIGNQVSFIIADDIGYIFFPQSKIFEEEPKGPNALLMDDIFKTKLIAHYFPPQTEQEKTQFIHTIIDLDTSSKNELKNISDLVQHNKTDISLSNLDNKKLVVVKKNLEINPPLQPDIKRKIETYTAKVQFAELKFDKANFHSKKINIPSEALPYKDVEIKESLETKLSLFTDVENNSDIKKFIEINKKVDALRYHPSKKELPPTIPDNVFLIPISCRGSKSIIKVPRKKEFKERIAVLEAEIENYKTGTLANLEDEMLKRKEKIKKELFDFLKANPPLNYSSYSKDLFIRKIEDESQKIVAKIKFPDISELVSGAELKYNFYDLTIEDFNDDELLAEFRKKGILTNEELDEIVSFKNAFEAAK